MDAVHQTKKECFLCKKVFPTDTQLSTHLTGIHKLVEINDNEPDKPVPVVGKPVNRKINKPSPNLNVSMYDQEEKAMECPLCQKVYF